MSKEDTYITAVSVGAIWKASLHSDAAWRIAMTSEHARSPSPVMDPAIGRKMWEFEPVPFENGMRMAFAIAPLRGSYAPAELDPTEIHVGVNDSWDEITVVYLWMTEPGIELEPERLIGGPLSLASGRQVWITAGTEHMSQKEEHDNIGSLIEPQIPGQHGVRAPGFFVRGCNWAK